MNTCGLEPDFEDCTEISECAKTVLEMQPNARLGSDYCHDSCETCGYVSEVGSLIQRRTSLCVTCPVGYEIEPEIHDCRGRCVLIGEATRSRECPELPAPMECVREPNVGEE